MSQQIEIMVSPVQLSLLQQALKIEIRTDGKMKLTSEPALRIFKRLIGVEVARGHKGREQALEIVEGLLAQCGE
jgi:hypothetical protein